MAKKISSTTTQRIGGHIEVHVSNQSVHRRIADVIYKMTHKKRDMRKSVSIFVAGGMTVDKKLEQVNRSVAKKGRI